MSDNAPVSFVSPAKSGKVHSFIAIALVVIGMVYFGLSTAFITVLFGYLIIYIHRQVRLERLVDHSLLLIPLSTAFLPLYPFSRASPTGAPRNLQKKPFL
jgi:hypothetical protein